MHLLLVNQSFYPDESASAQYATDIALAFRKNGWDVSILTSAEGYLDCTQKYSKFEELDGLRIHRVKAFFSSRRTKLSRIMSALSLNSALSLKLLRLPRADVIIVMTSPPLIGWITTRLARKPRMGVVYWVMDLNPDQAIAAGWLSPQSPIARLLEQLLKDCLGRTQLVITLDKWMKARLSVHASSAKKIAVLPLWPSIPTSYSAPNQSMMRREISFSEDDFLVMYSGNLSICHPVSTVLQAALSLRQIESVRFAFVGSGARAPEVREFIDTHKLPAVTLRPYVNRDSLADSLSAADLHIVSFGTPYVGIVHPSKIYSILAVGRPFVLVGPEECWINKEFVERGLGYRVDHGDSEGLLRIISIERAMSSSEREERAAQRIAAAEEYSLEQQSAKFMALVSDMRS